MRRLPSRENGNLRTTYLRHNTISGRVCPAALKCSVCSLQDASVHGVNAAVRLHRSFPESLSRSARPMPVSVPGGKGGAVSCTAGEPLGNTVLCRWPHPASRAGDRSGPKRHSRIHVTSNGPRSQDRAIIGVFRHLCGQHESFRPLRLPVRSLGDTNAAALSRTHGDKHTLTAASRTTRGFAMGTVPPCIGRERSEPLPQSLENRESAAKMTGRTPRRRLEPSGYGGECLPQSGNWTPCLLHTRREAITKVENVQPDAE